MSHPVLSERERCTQQTFSALMWALSYPGRPQPLRRQGLARFEMIAETLIDLETSYYSSDPELTRRLQFTGARSYAPDAARYQFYPVLRKDDLALLRDAPVGIYTYPDEGATVVIGCDADQGQAIRLRGPGIQGEHHLRVGGIPSGFWQVREQAIRYPLGWDVFLVTSDTVIGLPRSTILEVR